MDELAHPSCDLCGVKVLGNLRHFHKLWHESQTGQSTPFFEDQEVEPEVTQLLRVAAALRAVPPVTARAEFVRDLRERLMAEKFDRPQSSLSVATSHSEDE